MDQTVFFQCQQQEGGEGNICIRSVKDVMIIQLKIKNYLIKKEKVKQSSLLIIFVA